MDIAEKLEFIKKHDPEGAEKLNRLLGRKDALKEGNVYREKLTDRQFSLVVVPLLNATLERAKIIEALSEKEDTIQGLSEKLEMSQDMIFTHVKELMRKNLIGIAGHQERNAIFRKK
ncbi:MAG: ArsR family transcriptional regulator [Proteobacteria bacterium]|nr:ArsR family transcriptional regulator [Pseudomonadota bacterium]